MLRLDPRAIGAQLELSRLRLAQGAPEDSVRFARAALQQAPGNPTARLVLARGLVASGDLNAAQAELEGLQQEYSESAAVQAQLGELRLRQRDLTSARRSFERALELERDMVEPLAGLLAIDMTTQQVEQARVRVEAALARRPDDPNLLLLAARTYAGAGDYVQTERTLRNVMEVDPNNVQAYAMLAQLYLLQDNLDGARAEFEALASRQSRPTAAMTMAGSILQSQNRTSEARERYEQVLDLDPHAGAAANNLAWIYAQEGGNLDVALQFAVTPRHSCRSSPT